MIPVSIGTIDMNTNTPDGNGTLWYVGDFQGFDFPTLRTTTLDLPGQHGRVTVQNLIAGYDVTVTGMAKATSDTAYWASRNALASELAGALLPEDAITLTIGGTSLQVLASGLTFSHIGTCAFAFEFAVTTDDPTKT